MTRQSLPEHPMPHPAADELTEFHFGEVEGTRRDEVAAHLETCGPCRSFVSDLDSIELALQMGQDDRPPADGLERVLAQIGEVRQAREQRDDRLRALLPSVAAVGVGVAMIYRGGVVGALTFFLAGALVTLALAPVLILESQRRAS